MLSVTQAAQEKLTEFLTKQKTAGSFRVYQSYG